MNASRDNAADRDASSSPHGRSKRILLLCSAYTPSRESNGCLRAVTALVEALDRDYEFYILAADRDYGQTRAYPNVPSGTWSPQGRAFVYYASPRDLTPGRMAAAITAAAPDLYYVNSFLTPAFAIQPAFLRWLGIIPSQPMVVAPRGEFHPGSLRVRAAKKHAFIRLVRALPVYSNITWHAASSEEAGHIRTQMPGANVLIARDIVVPERWMRGHGQKKTVGHLSLVYLSRIARSKNLAVALSALSQVTGRVEFHVYGPAHEPRYYRECVRVARQLPSNIKVIFCGEVPHEDVGNILSRHHAFVLPTQSESFGHAIVEAFLAGCVPLIGDQTPWRRLEQAGIGWDLPANDTGAFARALQVCVDMSDEEFAERSARSRKLGNSIVADERPIQAHRDLFESALRLD